MEIRKGKIEDQGSISQMIYSAGSALYDYVYTIGKKSALAYIDLEFKQNRGFVGAKNMSVVCDAKGNVIAAASLYDGKKYNILALGTILNMIPFFGIIGIAGGILRSIKVGQVLKKPGKDELYLSNFAVDPSCQGEGIGTGFLKQSIADAKEKGYKKFLLDVEADNGGAIRLYKRLGFVQTGLVSLKGGKRGINVPDIIQFEIVLSK